MPRGYYLGQGLIPLGHSSSDDEEGPCELPSGRLVCGPHGLVVCGRCCSDYSFMDDVLSDNDDDDDDDSDKDSEDSQTPDIEASPGPKIHRGTGRVFPTKFIPPSDSITPTQLFSRTSRFGNFRRYTRPDNSREFLILTDGACLDNGGPNPRAGWAFVHGPGTNGGPPQVQSDALERQGPYGDSGAQTSNRAELRAVIAALRFRYWVGEGFQAVVIATNSEYVVDGATQWAKSWISNDWKTQKREDVKNRDLWEMLLGEVERWNGEGMTIRFWRIPRELNTDADAAAKKAASEMQASPTWTELLGVCA